MYAVPDALTFAMECHGTQVRKITNTSYYGHLLNVCGLVTQFGGNTDQQVAALLHDVLEDTPTEYADLTARYGSQVARIVLGLTDETFSEKPTKTWRVRKSEYLDRLKVEHPDVVLVSMCDKIDNLRSTVHGFYLIEDQVFDKFSGKKAGLVWYYESLNEIYGQRMAPDTWCVFDDALRQFGELIQL